MTWLIDRPKEFPGTDEEAARNRATHFFLDDRCMDCDCRPWGRTVNWPCGAEVPREKARVSDAS